MEQQLQPQATPQPPPQPKQTPQNPQQKPPQPKQTPQNPSQKPPEHHHESSPNKKPNNNNNKLNNKPIWDCNSTLYDSFELNSFQKQLDSAIINSSRSLSMPRLPSEDHRAPPPQPPPTSKKSTLSRSFQKLLRSVFRAPKSSTTNHSKPNYDSSSPDPWFLGQEQDKDNIKVVDSGRYFVVFEKPKGLSTIPEVPEVGFSPEIRSLVRKTMSDRFSFTPPVTSDGIYCA